MKRIINLVLLVLASSPAFTMSDPFAVYVRTAYPPEIVTIKEAANYVLAPLGYQYIDDYPSPLDAASIGDSRIPPIAKIHRIMPIIDALQLLIGEQNYIVIDSNNKLVSFTRVP